MQRSQLNIQVISENMRNVQMWFATDNVLCNLQEYHRHITLPIKEQPVEFTVLSTTTNQDLPMIKMTRPVTLFCHPSFSKMHK